MAKKADTALLSFKFIATGVGLWFAWTNYKKKEELAAAQMLALKQDSPRTATTPLSIPTGQPLAYQNTVFMQTPADTRVQEAQPTRPLDQLYNIGGKALVQKLQDINI